KNLDVGVPESLAYTEGLASFDGCLVLRDLLVCELGHEFKTGLDLFHGLGLEDTCCHCLCPDGISDLGPDKYGAPPVGAADRAGGDVTEVGNVVEADLAAWLFVLVGNLERQLDYLSALAVYPELALADLHFLDGLKLHSSVVFHELEDALVREVLHAEDTDCKCNAVANIAETDRVELALADCLHLAGGTDDTNLVETKRAGSFLDHGDVGADVVLGACRCDQFSLGVDDRRDGPPGLDHIPVRVVSHYL